MLEEFVSPYDLRRLELYATNMADYHLITDLLPAVARLFLLGRFGDCHLSPVQTVSGIGPRSVRQASAILAIGTLFDSRRCYFSRSSLL